MAENAELNPQEEVIEPHLPETPEEYLHSIFSLLQKMVPVVLDIAEMLNEQRAMIRMLKQKEPFAEASEEDRTPPEA